MAATARKSATEKKPQGRPSSTPTAAAQIRMKALEFAFKHRISAPSEVNAEEMLATARVYERYIVG